MAAFRLTRVGMSVACALVLVLQLVPSQAQPVVLNTIKLSRDSSACKIVLQGELASCKARSDFGICNVELSCVGDTVQVDVHQAMQPFIKEFQGVLPGGLYLCVHQYVCSTGIRARVVNNATELIKITAPKNITLTESAINNLRMNRDGMVILSFNDSTIVSIFDFGIFNNSGRCGCRHAVLVAAT